MARNERPDGHRPMFDQDAGRGSSGRRQAAPETSTYRRQSVPRAPGSGRRSASGQGSTQRQHPAAYRPTQVGRGGAAARRRKKKRTRNAILIVIFLLIIAIGIGVWAAVNGIGKQISGRHSGQGEIPKEYATLPEYTGAGIVNFLVCGLDYDDEGATSYSTDEKIGRTDMILYVHYDTVNNKANILQLPRDTYVGNEALTGGTGKINGLYFFAQDENNRMAALAKVLYEQFKLPVDFYITIDMDAVKEIIDIINSTTEFLVYVPIDVQDPDSGDVMEAGWRAFTGESAEYFLRNRKSATYNDQGDIMRLQMQQYFYSAIYREFSGLSPTDLVMWMNVLMYRVKTDMDTPSELVQLGGLAQKALALTGEDIVFIRPAMGGTKNGTHSLLTLIDDEFADLLNEYFRPEGESYTVAELGIKSLPVIDTMGVYETNIRSIGDIQETEEPVA